MKSFTALALTLLVSACGPKSVEEDHRDTEPDPEGSGGQGGAPNEIVCSDPNEPIDPTAVIDDLEDQDAEILVVSGRNGGWWTAGDLTVGATMFPTPADQSGELALPEALPEPRCESQFAMRVTGQGFLDWGALLGMSLAFGERPNGEEGGIGYDASARQGVDFWARIGDTSTNMVRFAVSDSYNEPDGGICGQDDDLDHQCYDTFGVYLTELDTTWHHYRIPFAGLAQRDFGYEASGVETHALFAIQFNFDPSDVFDFWVDDISFY